MKKYLPLPLKRKLGITCKHSDIYQTWELLSGKLIVTYEYVGYDSGDESGFGMEDEYDFHFFDGKERYLGTLCAWSKRDIIINKDRIEFFLMDVPAKK